MRGILNAQRVRAGLSAGNGRLTFTMYLLHATRAASRASEEICSFSQLHTTQRTNT